MSYTYTLEDGNKTVDELLPLYRRHYEEMRARLAADGIETPGFNPRRDQYEAAWSAGYLLNFVARLDGKPVGYANIYLTNNMHNGEFMATEDTVYVLPEHRSGVGRKLIKFFIVELEKRGCRSFHITTSTDLRVHKLLTRMGFKTAAYQMILDLNGGRNVRT